MSDLISRQQAIDCIDAVFPVDPMKSEYTQGIACGAALAKTYVEQLPSTQQWIPCSERMPKSGRDRILICLSKSATQKTWFNDTGRVFEGGYSDNGFHVVGQRRICENGDVIAWMPLPEPYKG